MNKILKPLPIFPTTQARPHVRNPHPHAKLQDTYHGHHTTMESVIVTKEMNQQHYVDRQSGNIAL